MTLAKETHDDIASTHDAEIAELVRSARQPGIVRSELARRCGVSRQHYHYIHTHEEVTDAQGE